ncbi:hypothetical protein [Glaciecola petra]|uniref:Alpha/beta hydrolase n=1 Tax=Glaciecola petra TaxID=3075602 RepID=A0ABU2ZL38_9ALTE|nr:hypothetical protein [Aestuariibacter sp. P117]MDT0593335.1 hypothetical protein [Aestuariibacter sp. P117]
MYKLNKPVIPVNRLLAIKRLLIVSCTALVCVFLIACEQTNQQSANKERPSQAPVGKHLFLFTQWQGPAIKVWAYKPKAYNQHTKVLFVMHGTNRDADRYRDEWADHAEQNNILLIVPQFSREDFPGADGYNLGNMFAAGSDYQSKNIKAQWSYSAIEPLFSYVKRAYQNTQSTYMMYGHSAGSQFVHRFIYFVPEARASKIISANAGWYTMPNFELNFPYGLKNTTATQADITKALQKPLLVLLGEDDNDPNHRSLRKAEQAMLQGPHRLARGHTFFAQAQLKAHTQNIDFEWQLVTVPNVGHQNGLMAKAAIEYLMQDE